MPVQLARPPTLELSSSNPNPRGDRIGLQSAQWQGDARVRFTNEAGKTFLVGFVQVLETNMLQATYTKTQKTEVLKAGFQIPIRDGNRDPQFRPFYGTRYPATIVAVPDNGQHDVDVDMSDEPESQYDWWHNDDPTDPLTDFVMNMTFQTYVAVRDITAGFNPTTAPWLMQFLYQWAVTLDRRFSFTVVRHTSLFRTDGGPIANLTQTSWKTNNLNRQPLVLGVRNIRPPADSLLKSNDVANGAFRDEITRIGTRVISSGIRSRAAIFGGA